MFIVIRFGYEESGQLIGWLADRCHFCGEVQPFGCYQTARATQVGGVTVSSAIPHSKRIVCQFCNEATDFPLDASIQVNRDWEPRDGLQLLVDTTNPEIGRLPKKERRSLSEARAVLLRSEEWARFSFHNEGNLGCLIGAVALVSLVVGGVIGNAISRPEPATNYMIIFGVPFSAAISLGVYFLLKRYLLASKITARLDEVGSYHRITRVMFQEALKTIYSCPKVLRRAVEQLP